MLYRYIAYPELYSEPPGAQLGMRYEIGPIRLAGGQSLLYTKRQALSVCVCVCPALITE